MQELLGKVVLLAQIAITAIAFAGDAIFRSLNMAPPPIYLEYRDKKTGVLAAVWIIGNMIQNALTQTGAFEVYSAGELVSILPTGLRPAKETGALFSRRGAMPRLWISRTIYALY